MVIDQLIQPTDVANGDRFGESIDLEGNIIIAGSDNDDDNGTNSGSAYVFKDDGTGTWIQSQKITQPNATSTRFFGNSVAISQGRVVIDNDYSQGPIVTYVDNGTGTFEEEQQIIPGLTVNSRRLAYHGEHLMTGHITFNSKHISAGGAYIYSCEMSHCNATAYNASAACSPTSPARMRVDISGGVGPFTVEFDINNDNIADFVKTNYISNQWINVNINTTTTFKLINVIDEFDGSSICNVDGEITLYQHNLVPGEIGPAQSICSGETPNILSFNIPPTSDGTVSYYRWYARDLVTNSFTQVAFGSNQTTYSPPALTNSTEYSVSVQSSLSNFNCGLFTDRIRINVGDPNATEICDGFDNNCDGNIDEGLTLNTYYLDSDLDGFGDASVSIDTCLTSPPFGYSSDNTDCNDDCNICYPGALDFCNVIDEDCDGIAYENCICPDLEINNITINAITSSNGITARAFYLVEFENTGSDTAFMSEYIAQHHYSDDNISFNGDEIDLGGYQLSTLTAQDTLLAGETTSFIFSVISNHFVSDTLPYFILELKSSSGGLCNDSTDIIVLVDDNIAPTMNCQNHTVNLNANGLGIISPLDINNNSSDNNGYVSFNLDISQFDCDHIGSNQVILTGYDYQSNHSSCTAQVLVVDNIAPTVTCQDFTVSLDNMGNASVVPSDVILSINDACGIDNTHLILSSVDCSLLGTNTDTLTVEDQNGNTTLCPFVLTVEDPLTACTCSEDPVAICQDISVALDNNGVVNITATAIDNGSTDDCGVASITIDQSSLSCADIIVGNPINYSLDYDATSSFNTQNNFTNDISIHNGMIYISKRPEDVVKVYDLSTGTLSFQFGEAGSGTGQFGEPESIAFDASDNIYVSDRFSAKILKFDPSGNFISEFSTGGGIENIVIEDDTIYVAKDNAGFISMYALDGTFISDLINFPEVSGLSIKNNLIYGVANISWKSRIIFPYQRMGQ